MRFIENIESVDFEFIGLTIGGQTSETPLNFGEDNLLSFWNRSSIRLLLV